MRLARCWGLSTAVPAALALGLVASLFWSDQAEVPRVPMGLPVPELFPVLASVLLTWPLVERWQEQLNTSVRPVWLVPAARLTVTQAVCILSALVASGGLDIATLGRCSIGASLAALLTPALGGRTGLAMLLLGYGWLLLSVRSDTLARVDTTLAALVALVVGGGCYVLSAVGRAP